MGLKLIYDLYQWSIRVLSYARALYTRFTCQSVCSNQKTVPSLLNISFIYCWNVLVWAVKSTNTNYLANGHGIEWGHEDKMFCRKKVKETFQAGLQFFLVEGMVGGGDGEWRPHRLPKNEQAGYQTHEGVAKIGIVGGQNRTGEGFQNCLVVCNWLLLFPLTRTYLS